MNRMILLFTVITLGVCLPMQTQADKLKIVTTTSDLASIAKAVAGNAADVRSICTGREDPHFLQAKPSYIMLARNADLWIRIGLELEIGWEPPILDGSRNSRIRPGMNGHLDASANALILDVPNVQVTRSMGDVHPLGNPHYWLDPYNGRCIANAIAERLCLLAPANAELFKTNAASFQKSLDEHMFGKTLIESEGGNELWNKTLTGTLDTYLNDSDNTGKLGGWLATMLPIDGRKILTYHRSWIYFANRFGLSIAGELEPKPGIPPSPAHLAEMVELVKAQSVGIILLEPFYSRKAADYVADKTGAKVVVTANSVGGEPSATDYITLIDLIVNRIAGTKQ